MSGTGHISQNTVPTLGAGSLLESGLLLDHSWYATTLSVDSFKISLIIHKPIDLSNGR